MCGLCAVGAHDQKQTDYQGTQKCKLFHQSPPSKNVRDLRGGYRDLSEFESSIGPELRIHNRKADAKLLQIQKSVDISAIREVA